MSYYEPQGWQAPAARQASWEQPAPPSRSGMGNIFFYQKKAHKIDCLYFTGSSSVSQREDIPAFSSQFDGMDTPRKFPIAFDSTQDRKSGEAILETLLDGR
jgi:hypothetical protein